MQQLVQQITRRKTKTLALVFVQFFTLLVIIIIYFNLCSIFENMTSFTPILNKEVEKGKLMAVLNSQK